MLIIFLLIFSNFVAIKLVFSTIQVGKEAICNAGDKSLMPGLRRYPGEGNDNPLQCPCLGNPLRQRNMVGYDPGIAKELDTTNN